ncbi:MAG TPA: molecular chaperone HtpG [Polyangiaceae bacterium]|nr:molecular chaperone HtpG [Polyangiaceae bacterium]
MSDTVERHEFQAEVKQLLDLMVHSLYSDKDVFLRELVSNASDALDKLRFERLTDPELGGSDELAIRLEPNPAAHSLSIVDNGIGMTRDEIVKNLGTIAKSGTKEFLSAVRERGGKDMPPELIGQFGVGFYSAFMVAKKIVVVSRRAGSEQATRWESSGDGSYTLGDTERSHSGTTVTLELKPRDEEQDGRDYTDEQVLRRIVKRYSDFVAYPIKLSVWKTPEGAKAGEKVLEDVTLNSLKAIWDRPKSEVSEEEYKAFYRHLSHDWNDPLRTLPIRLEGTLEAYALLYLPARAPFDLYSPEMKRGVQLYVKRVFVLDECKDLVPSYLRFVRGVVDAHDLSLNVSREILQKDRQIQIIKKQLVKRVLATLEEMKREKPEEYAGFWSNFGPVLKEGLLEPGGTDRDKLLELLRAETTHGAEPTTLEDYALRMKEGQSEIYFLLGPTKEAAAQSPLLESFRAKGYEVLLFSDPVDEIWLDHAPEFKGKALKSVGRGEVELGTVEERQRENDELKQKQETYADLLQALRVHVQDEIKEVRLSSRLTSSPACLVGDEHDMTPRMQRMLEQLGQKAPKVTRILELNPTHPLIEKLESVFKADRNDPRLELYAKLLLGQAHLAESGQVPDPVAFSKVLADVLVRAS